MKEDQETKLIAPNIFVRYLEKFGIHMRVEQTIRGFVKIMDISIYVSLDNEHIILNSIEFPCIVI